MLPVLVTAAVGIVLLAVLVVVAWRSVRRFTRAEVALRAGMAKRMAALRALAPARRSGPR
jgi:hypothetical protein